ncbi:terpene synthase family protein [Actinomadura atramentaria]|uniref:terpene synthase family protein n=1 Tax=Actinomadura atramentaria TaxID=1990 RepID=UPI000399ED7F|nr:terpene synthase family protein [Actinomadura atramentaria]
MDVSSLLYSLGDRVAVSAPPAGPAVPRADVRARFDDLAARVDEWTRTRGLAGPRPPARCERLAARLFPTAPPDRVELFACWTAWAFALDDLLDEDPLGGSANSVHALFDDLGGALRRGGARPGARPLEAALAELWRATGRLQGRAWRRRFLTSLEEQRAGCAQEAVHRRMREIPDLRGYPSLRRRAGAPFLFDLIEPVLGVELPGSLFGTPCWTALAEAAADTVAWCNDIASYPREFGRGDVHNHVTVLGAAYGFAPERAARTVCERIGLRAADLAAAGRALPATLDLMRYEPTERLAAERVARVLLAAPRAHLDWLIESSRYATAAWPEAVPSPR